MGYPGCERAPIAPSLYNPLYPFHIWDSIDAARFAIGSLYEIQP